METQATGETEYLKACINDLIAIVALPAMWSGSEPDGIAGMLLDALVAMLQLDLAFIQLAGPDRDAPIRMVRAADARAPLGEVDELSARFERTFGRDLRAWPSSGRLSLAGRDLSLSMLPLGLQGAVGIIVAGSSRDDFPGPTERLLLNVAANQAVVGVQEARIRHDQRRV